MLQLNSLTATFFCVDFERVKRLSIIAMVSDDDLLDRLVLKGGNALDIAHNISTRASMDIDFSIEDDFSQMGFAEFKRRVSISLVDTFGAEEYVAFDIKIEEVPSPERMDQETKKFWGGYTVNFKLTPKLRFESLSLDPPALRKDSLTFGPNQKRIFSIQISKFEFCSNKMPVEIDGYRVYVYTPELLLAEKLRAICQQMPEFADTVSTHRRARARDFFDIWLLRDRYSLEPNSIALRDLITAVFAAKRVPLRLIERIPESREFHRLDFDAVRDTVRRGHRLRDFDFYFDHVIAFANELKTFWIE